MSKEKFLRTLTDLGLKKTEAKVYFFLSKKGPKKAIEIANAIHVTKQRLYPILKNLQNRGIINSSLDRPSLFSAISYEKFLDLFAKTKVEEAKIIEENKNKLLDAWETISYSFSKDKSDKFIILKGRQHIYSKIRQMVEESIDKLCVICDFSSLLRLEKFGVLDNIKSNPTKSNMDFFIVTGISQEHIRIVKEFLRTIDSSIKVRDRGKNGISSIFPRLIIRDNKELLYFISKQDGSLNEERDDICILTNCSSLISPFSKLFENLWTNSIDIMSKIHELETGETPQRTLIIENKKLASELFNTTIENAKKEIIMVLPSKELVAYWKRPAILKSLNEKGVHFKIMTPISRKNLDACMDLLGYVEVRHVPNEYVKTIMIDDKHLFQFKFEKKNYQKNLKDFEKHEQTIYSNDFDFVKKTKKMLLDIWKSSPVPSPVTANAIMNQQLSKFDTVPCSETQFVDVVYNSGQFYQNAKQSKISEDEVINEIKNFKNFQKSNQNKISLCGTVGYALIRSHPNFSFPNILIAAYDVNEQSTFGAENAMIISMEMKTVTGEKYYIPVTVIGDNPKASEQWKRTHEGSGLPARNNYHLFERSEIHIQTLGNVFFAGWTKPIPLLSGLNPLPPSAVLLERTGKIQSRCFEITLGNGIKQQQRFNYSDAFVTFIHQQTKYQGPSTDGSLLREMYIKNL